MGSSRVQRRLFFRLRAEQAKTRQALGSEYDHGDGLAAQQVADELGVSEHEVAAMDARLSHRDSSLDAPLSDSQSTTHLDRLQGPQAPDAEQHAAHAQMVATVRQAIDDVRPLLNAKESAILDGRLFVDDAKSLQELGDTLSVSRERVRQLETRVKLRLKEALSARGLAEAV